MNKEELSAYLKPHTKGFTQAERFIEIIYSAAFECVNTFVMDGLSFERMQTKYDFLDFYTSLPEEFKESFPIVMWKNEHDVLFANSNCVVKFLCHANDTRGMEINRYH